MRYGYFMMPLHPPGQPMHETIERDLRQIETLDRLGYHEAWIGEHFTTEWENIPSPDTFIAAALQRTTNILLGTGVACLPNHSPFVLAHRIAQLDQMARGRFLFGIGSGGYPGDFEVFGVDPASGAQRSLSRDSIDTVLKLWEDPRPGIYAEHTWRFRVPEANPTIGQRIHARPYQKPHPPIGVAGVSERSETLALAGERGWIPMSINLVPERVLTGHWETVEVEAGARTAGRPLPSRATWRIARNVHVAETSAKAREEAIEGAIGRDFREYFLPLMRYAKIINLAKQDPNQPDESVTPEYLADNVWVVGDPAEVARKLRDLYHAVGGFGTLLALAHDWPEWDVWERSTTLLAQEVMPRLADL